MDKFHPNEMPEGYTHSRYFYFLQTKKTEGKCIVDGRATKWNEATQKYERFCDNPKCKEKYREVFKNRMINKYGKVHLLDNPDMQRKMVSSRKISGQYKFKDDGMVSYVGSYEKEFLMMLDTMLQFNSGDIMAPSPHTYYYDYVNPNDKENEGERFYIPDFYIPSLNLEIEVKSHTNQHYKIQAIDRVKEEDKDKVMEKIPTINYVKVVDKDYSAFFEKLLELKEQFATNDSNKNDANNAALESLVEIEELDDEIVEESYLFNNKNLYINFDKFTSGESNILFITGLSGSGKSTISKSLASEYKAEVIELDIFEHSNAYLDKSLAKAGEVFKIYLLEKRKDLRDKTVKEFSREEFYSEFTKFFDFVLEYCNSHKNKKFIIEGVQIFSLVELSKIKEMPIILMGTSVKTSVLQRFKRDTPNGKIDWKSELKNEFPQLIAWYIDNEKKYNDFKKSIATESESSYVVESFINNCNLTSYTDTIVQESIFDIFNSINTSKESLISSWKSRLFVSKNALGSAISSKIDTVSLIKNKQYIQIQHINIRRLINMINEKYGEVALTKLFILNYNSYDYKKFKKKQIPRGRMRIESLTIPIFFALEAIILFDSLYEDYNIYAYKTIAQKIYNLTWISKSDTSDISALSLKNLKRIDRKELLPYQKEFIEIYPALKSKLNLRGYINAFEQGLGKTLTAIGLAECLDAKRIYIVCPNTLKDNWALEIKEYYNKYMNNDELWRQEVVICDNNPREISKARFIITNNESISKMYPYITDEKKSMFILDESHNFRNINGQRVGELLDLVRKINSDDNLIMSGTPIKAIPNEIVPALLMIDPLFTIEAAEIYTKCFNISSTAAMEIVQKRFGMVMYRKTKSELSLPDKEIHQLSFKLSDSEKYTVSNCKEEIITLFYGIYEEKMKSNMDLQQEYINFINKYSRASESDTAKYIKWVKKNINTDAQTYLHELDMAFMKSFVPTYVKPNINNANDFKRVDRLEKEFIHMDRSAMGLAIGKVIHPRRSEMFIRLYNENKDEIIDMIENNNKKVIIFSQFEKVVEFIAKDLNEQGIKTLLITGNVKTNRTDTLTQFKEDDEVQVLVATSQTMSTGVTLVDANKMFFFGPPWRSTDFDQACDRIHRIGQSSKVDIYLVTLDTGEKKNLATRMVDILNWSQDMFDSAIKEENLIDGIAEAMESAIFIESNDIVTNKMLSIAQEEFIMNKNSLDKIKIQKGAHLQRLTLTRNENNNNRHIYVSKTKEDNDKYLIEWGNRGYKVILEVTNDIIIPSYKERFDIFLKVMEKVDINKVVKDISALKYRNNSEKFMNEWKNRHITKMSNESYISFISSLINSEYNREIFFKELKEYGYNATIDDNDAAEWTYRPIIIFERNKNVKQIDCIKINNEMIEDSKKRLHENIIKKSVDGIFNTLESILPIESDEIYTINSESKELPFYSNIVEFLNEYYDKSNDIVLESSIDDDKKFPIFIVLMHSGTALANAIKAVTKDKFSHACISFSVKLNPLYSFGRKDLDMTKTGFVTNSPKDRFFTKFKAYYSVYVIYVTKQDLDNMKSRLDFFIKNENKLRYDVKGLLLNYVQLPNENRKKYFCSRFVADILSSGKIIDKSPSLYRPNDFVYLKDVIKIDEGDDFYKYDWKVAFSNLNKINKGDEVNGTR